MALPPLAIRGDLGVLSTAGIRYAPSLLKSFIKMGPQGALGATKLLRPFSEIVDSLNLKDPFVRNWIDLLCFLLAGVKSDGVIAAEIVINIQFSSLISHFLIINHFNVDNLLFSVTSQIYMLAEWYKPGCSLEYPLNGSGDIVTALVRGMQKFGGRLALRCHVDNIVIENGRAIGVKLRSGQVMRYNLICQNLID